MNVWKNSFEEIEPGATKVVCQSMRRTQTLGPSTRYGSESLGSQE